MRAIEVVPVSEARAGLPGYVRVFRSNPDAAPVVIGSHRRPEAVVVGYETYVRLLERLEDAEIRAMVEQRGESSGGRRLSTSEVFEAAGLSHLVAPDLLD